jgi:hypothetical protein
MEVNSLPPPPPRPKAKITQENLSIYLQNPTGIRALKELVQKEWYITVITESGEGIPLERCVPRDLLKELGFIKAFIIKDPHGKEINLEIEYIQGLEDDYGRNIPYLVNLEDGKEFCELRISSVALRLNHRPLSTVEAINAISDELLDRIKAEIEPKLSSIVPLADQIDFIKVTTSNIEIVLNNPDPNS